jgi:toxin ParE1/3/4
VSRYGFTREADQYLEGIHHFIARDSPSRADRFGDRLEAVCQDLADMPGMGRVWPDLGGGMRRFLFGDYLIYYRPSADGVEILRVLHGARDIRRALRQPPAP